MTSLGLGINRDLGSASRRTADSMCWPKPGRRAACSGPSRTLLATVARTPLCPAARLLFPRRIKNGTEFDLTRQATSPEISAMIIRGLSHVGFDTSGFSGISARRGGLSTAIEAGVPEAFLWMQSGHAQDLAARRYVELNSPALLYRTYESFDL
jgi:hypothetical protein